MGPTAGCNFFWSAFVRRGASQSIVPSCTKKRIVPFLPKYIVPLAVLKPTVQMYTVDHLGQESFPMLKIALNLFSTIVLL
jgi:hypothetical protein